MGFLNIIQVTHSEHGGVVSDPWYVQYVMSSESEGCKQYSAIAY